jgi:hypothetical protein
MSYSKQDVQGMLDNINRMLPEDKQYTLGTWSPGDGMTRYFLVDQNDQSVGHYMHGVSNAYSSLYNIYCVLADQRRKEQRFGNVFIVSVPKHTDA